MAETPPDDGSFWKLLGFIVGTAAGVGAKLATMHRVKAINMTDVVVNSAVAFAAAFLVYNVLAYYGHSEAAIIASVLCGRFADDVLSTALRMAKKMITVLNSDINQKK